MSKWPFSSAPGDSNRKKKGVPGLIIWNSISQDTRLCDFDVPPFLFHFSHAVMPPRQTLPSHHASLRSPCSNINNLPLCSATIKGNRLRGIKSLKKPNPHRFALNCRSSFLCCSFSPAGGNKLKHAEEKALKTRQHKYICFCLPALSAYVFTSRHNK